VYPYREFGEAFGIREGIEAGLIADGDALVFIATDSDTGRVLTEAKLKIGDGDDARLIAADAEGRIAFPLELALMDANPPITVLSDVEHPELSFDGTLSLECDESGGGGRLGRRALEASDYDGLVTAAAGRDRVYALDDRVTAQQRKAMVAQLARVRGAFSRVTGWDPPALAVVLTAGDRRDLAPSADRDGRQVWALGVSEIDDRDRSTAFLAHEWTHVSLRVLAPASGTGQPGTRWIEDGLCELVAHEVERELFPGDDTRTRTGRLESLERDDPEIPNEVDLVSFAGEATSMYGQIAAMCQGGALYGYAYALAFWHAADLDRTRLREVIAGLSQTSMIQQARDLAPPGLAELKLDRQCAIAILRGDRTCARE
jgi:hypothetical protein